MCLKIMWLLLSHFDNQAIYDGCFFLLCFVFQFCYTSLVCFSLKMTHYLLFFHKLFRARQRTGKLHGKGYVLLLHDSRVMLESQLLWPTFSFNHDLPMSWFGRESGQRDWLLHIIHNNFVYL